MEGARLYWCGLDNTASVCTGCTPNSNATTNAAAAFPSMPRASRCNSNVTAAWVPRLKAWSAHGLKLSSVCSTEKASVVPGRHRPLQNPRVSSCVACAATLAAAYCGSQLVVVVVVVALPPFACSGLPVMSVVSSVLYDAPAATTGCCKCFISSCSHVTPNSSEYDVCHVIPWRW